MAEHRGSGTGRPGSGRPGGGGPRKPPGGPAGKAPFKRAPRSGDPRPKAPALPEIPVSPSRAAAYTILERVEMSSAHSDDLLHGPAMSELSQADRNLTTALVLGVLRWQIALDARIIPLLARPDVAVSTSIATALRLGAFQLLYMDRIPVHAAINESVELTRRAGQAHGTGMVNAILRKLATAEPVKVKIVESVEVMAERLGHPGWLVERWVKNFGRAAALAICEYDQREPESGGLFPDAAGLPHLDDGSRLVAELAAATVVAPKRIWDCCAAPGGKTLVLAARHPEAEVLATDVSPKRLTWMGLRLKNDGAPHVRVLEADAAKLEAGEGEFDLILCDVPCSGTGTLARNPEIRHHLRPSDLERQVKRQVEILGAALKRLTVGGKLLYSTCSLEPEENEAVLEEAMKGVSQGRGIFRMPVEPLLETLRESGVLAVDEARISSLVKDGALRTLPGVGFQGDGFFAAVFERRG